MSEGVGSVGLPPRTLFAGSIAIGLLVSLAFVFDLGGLLTLLTGADPVVFALGLVSIVVAVVCWGEAQRRLLIAAGASLSTRNAFLGFGTGMFAKQVLPGGHAIGPGLVAYTFRSVTRRSYSETLAAVTLAELLNVVVSGAFATVGLLLLLNGESSPTLVAARRALTFAGIAFVLLVAVAWFRRNTVTMGIHAIAWLVRGSAGRVSRRVRDAVAPERVAGGIVQFYAVFDTVARQRRQVALAFCFTLVGWLGFVAPLYTSFQALEVSLPLGVVLFAVPAAGLANVVPLPGGLGGVELALGGTIVALLGVDVTTAAAGVLLYRLCAFWFLATIGGLCAATLRIGVDDLAESVSEANARPE